MQVTYYKLDLANKVLKLILKYGSGKMIIILNYLTDSLKNSFKLFELNSLSSDISIN